MFSFKFSPGEIQFNQKRYKTGAELLLVMDGKIFPATRVDPKAELIVRLYVDKYSVYDSIHQEMLYEGSGDYDHKPRRFVCCLEGIHRYFEDYLESLRDRLNLRLIVFKDPEGLKFTDFDLYIFLQFPHQKMRKNFVLWNTEQLTRTEYLNQVKRLLSEGIRVLDYSSENLYLLSSEHTSLPGTSALLSYQYDQKEVERLKSYAYRDSTQEPEYDIVFVGTMSSKRQKILSILKSMGYLVKVVDGWKEERDRELMKGKLLVNIHYSDLYSVYESIRCDRLVFAEMIVVTERSQNQNQVDINPLLLIEEYDDLIPRIKYVLENYDQVRSEFLKLHRELLPGIIHKRAEQLKHLDTHLLSSDTIQSSSPGLDQK